MGKPPLALVMAFGLTLGLTFLVRRLALRLGVVDRPNERSSHRSPVPRGGGLAVVLAVAATVAWLVPLGPGLVLGGLCVAAVALVSLMDDLRSLPFPYRLAVQAVAAVVAVILLDLPVKEVGLPGLAADLPRGLGLALAILFTVAYCNFFNFMDGINGLAAGQAVISAAALALLLREGACATGMIVSAAVCGSAAGFLPYNFPVARIFLGDAGSVTLGFVLALLSQVVHARGGTPWEALLLVHAVFLFDTGFTLGKRAWRGENLARPHREHSYQLLVRGGWSHAATTLLLWTLSLGCCVAAVLYERSGGLAQWFAALVPAAVLMGFAAVAHGLVLPWVRGRASVPFAVDRVDHAGPR